MKMWVKLDRIGGINGSGIYFYPLRDVHSYTVKAMFTEIFTLKNKNMLEKFKKWLEENNIWNVDIDDYLTGYREGTEEELNSIQIDIPDYIDMKTVFNCWSDGSYEFYPDEVELPVPERYSDIEDTLVFYECRWLDKKMFMKVEDGSILDNFVSIERKQYEEKVNEYKILLPKLVKINVEKGKIQSISFEEYTDEIIKR